MDFSELTVVLAGEAIHIVGKERFRVKKGDVYVIHQETAHGYQQPHNFRICNMMFKSSYFQFEQWDLFKMIGFKALFDIEPSYAHNQKFISHLYLTETINQQVMQLIEEMIREYQQKQVGYQTVVRAHFYYLLTMLVRNYPTQPQKEDDLGVIALAKTVSYIENHYQQALTVEDLANYAHYSRRHLLRLFQTIYHMTPSAYITSVRLEHAMKQLSQTNKEISEIAMWCGFNQINYFYRVFQHKVGMSPGQYRKQTIGKNYT